MEEEDATILKKENVIVACSQFAAKYGLFGSIASLKITHQMG